LTRPAAVARFSGVTTTAARFQVQNPARFTLSAIVTSCFYGFILLLPVLLAVVAMTAFRFGPLTFLVPLMAIAVATFFLPLGFGNPYICRLVRPLRPGSAIAPDQYVVQLTREPRIHSGLRATLEDADDIGVLSYSDAGLEFNGDSVKLSVPFGDIRELRQRNAGPRALFVYGAHTAFTVAGQPEAGVIRLAERSSWLLPTSHKNANRMYRRLKEKVEAAGAVRGS
jgi:hypothetical protein